MKESLRFIVLYLYLFVLFVLTKRKKKKKKRKEKEKGNKHVRDNQFEKVQNSILKGLKS